MTVTSLENQLSALHTRKQEIAQELHECDNDRRDMNEAIAQQNTQFEDQKAKNQLEVDRHQGVVDNLLHQLKVATANHSMTKADLDDLQRQYVVQKTALHKAKDTLQETVRQADGCAVLLHREKRHKDSLQKDYDRLMATTIKPKPKDCPSTLDTVMPVYFGLAGAGVAILGLLAGVAYLAIANYHLKRRPGGRIPVGRLNNENPADPDQELQPQSLGTPPPREPRHQDAAQALAHAAGRVGLAAAPSLISFQ